MHILTLRGWKIPSTEIVIYAYNMVSSFLNMQANKYAN